MDIQSCKPSDFALFESDSEADMHEAHIMAGCCISAHHPTSHAKQDLASPAANEAASALAPTHPVTASPQAVRRATVPSTDGAAMPPAEPAAADAGQSRASKRLRLVTSSQRV